MHWIRSSVTALVCLCSLFTFSYGEPMKLAAVGPNDAPVGGDSSQQKAAMLPIGAPVPAAGAPKAAIDNSEAAAKQRAIIEKNIAEGKRVVKTGVDGDVWEKAGEEGTTTRKSAHGSPGFIHALVASFSMIFVSEIGDKTFFISAIMSMRHSRLTVFSGALTALALMHTLSAVFGLATTIIPRAVTYYVSSALFFIFGLKMLKEGWYMSPDEGQEEFEETQAELKKYEEVDGATTQDPETGIVKSPTTYLRFLRPFFSGIFLKAAVLNFLAEWGDRSQITAIILAAREDVTGVIIGGVVGHAICTGMAVICGRFISQRISIRTVTLIGGVTFLVFALSAFIVHPAD